MDLTRASLGGISSTGGGYSGAGMSRLPNGQSNPYQMEAQHGVEDLTWLLG
jgi:hypothetical protein